MDETRRTDQTAREKETEQRQKIEATRQALKELIAAEKLPAARPLTRGQRRKLDEAGVNIRKVDYAKKRVETAVDEMADWILDNVYAEFCFDALPNNVCTLFAMYVYQLTYEDDIAAKN